MNLDMWTCAEELLRYPGKNKMFELSSVIVGSLKLLGVLWYSLMAGPAVAGKFKHYGLNGKLILSVPDTDLGDIQKECGKVLKI